MMLEFKQVNTFYGRVQALHDVSLSVRKGEIVTLIGANGAGKSTLLMTLCGDPRAASGSILYEGQELIGQSTPEIIRKGIAVAPEGRRVFARLTVEENLAMGAFFSDKSEREQQLAHVLELFPRLKERFAQRAGTMSGGEQQMLAMARALMAQPKLLLLDEPSMGLSPIMVDKIFEVVRDVYAMGVTIVLVEQNASRALAIADRGYVMDSGVITMTGPGQELLADPRVRAAYLGE